MNPLWNELAQKAGITLADEAAGKLTEYLDLLLAANQKINLTRIVDRADAEIRHIGDSLTLLPFIPKIACAIADIGSGGGVPGIPLAIVRPDARVTLIESTKKKAAFLRDAIQKLALANVNVMDQRAEDVARGGVCESFDVVVARAVAEMLWLAEWCLPLVKLGGKVLAMKGAKAHPELSAALKTIRVLGGADPIVHPVDLPGTDHHVIVEIAKVGQTDAKYPRAATTAKGKPLQ